MGMSDANERRSVSELTLNILSGVIVGMGGLCLAGTLHDLDQAADREEHNQEASLEWYYEAELSREAHEGVEQITEEIGLMAIGGLFYAAGAWCRRTDRS